MTTRSVVETRSVARCLAGALGPGDIVLLVGDLGSGKTVFAQGLAEGLGYDGPVTSPTFTLVHHYDGRVPMLHADLYRLGSLPEIVDLGLLELGETESAVTVVEWGEMMASVAGSEYLKVVIEATSVDDRVVTFVPVGEGWHSRFESIVATVTR